MKKIVKILTVMAVLSTVFIGCKKPDAPVDPKPAEETDNSEPKAPEGDGNKDNTGADTDKKDDDGKDDKEESAKEVVLLNEEFTMAWSGRQFEVSNVPYGVKIVVHLKSKKESDNAIFRMAPTWVAADAFTKGTFDPEVWYFGTDGAISAPGFSDVNVVYFPSNAEVDALNTSKTLIIQGPGTDEGEETIIDSIKLVPPTKA